MMKNRSLNFALAFLALVLASLACSPFALGEPTETPEPTES